jgi:hypothetical protein
VEKGNRNEVVGMEKLPSGDILAQLKEQAGKKLIRSQQSLEQVAPSAKLVPDLIPVMLHRVRIRCTKGRRMTNQ